MNDAGIRPYADNVLLEFEAPPAQTASGLHIPQTKAKRGEHRIARVVSVGPGHYRRTNMGEAHSSQGLADAHYVFVPTEVKAGERVIVDAFAGQDYSLDVDVPRHNKGADFGDDVREFRIVREDEILGVIEPDEAEQLGAA